MQPRSLGLRSDLIFDRFQGEVRDHGDFIAVCTPAHPGYLWGHRLIMPTAPSAGDFDRWHALYDQTIGPMGFKIFTWENVAGAPGDIKPFLDAGFKFQRHTVLSTTAVVTPPYLSETFTIRPLNSAGDWDQYADVHYFEDPRFTAEELRAHTIGQRDDMRAMVEAGLGQRFGAFQGDRLLAELGIYWEGDIARFNSVATRAEARRQGACRTLVYHASRYVLENTPCKTLVIIADTDGPAGRVYQALGFRPTEELCKLEAMEPKPSPPV